MKSDVRTRAIVGMTGIVFFFLPVVALILGARPRPIENRALSPAPSLSAGYGVFSQFDAWADDYLPFQDLAVRLRANISLDVFGEAPGPPDSAGSPIDTTADAPTGAPARIPGGPERGAPASSAGDLPLIPFQEGGANPTQRSVSPAVLLGRGGWLFFPEELELACHPARDFSTVIDQLRQFQDDLAAQGKQFVFTIAPDKSSVTPGQLPDDYPNKTCSSEAQHRLFALLSQARIPGYVDMYDIILARQRAEERPLYYRKDTHWNTLASTEFAKQVVALVDPALLSDSTLLTGTQSYIGDLTHLLGTLGSDDAQTATWSRPGVASTVTQSTFDRIPVITARSTSTRAFLDTGPVLLVGDSFAGFLVSGLDPFFADITRGFGTDVPDRPDDFVTLVARSKTVVLVFNERFFADPTSGYLFSPAFRARLDPAEQAR